jgi:hypothetical protein
MYNVLNIFKKLEPTQEQQVKAEAQSIYESVEAKGSILEGVKGVEQKLRERFEKSKKADKDYDKDGKVETEKDEVIGSRRKAAGLDEGEVEKTASGLTHKSADKYGAGDEPFNVRNPGKYARDLDSVNKTQVKNLDASMGITYKNRGTKGVEIDEEREENPTIKGTEKKAKSVYNPVNKPGHVKRLDKPTNKYDNVKNEVAPPGKKAEKLVKSIKAGYSKDGKLTDKEKGIAYATAWKAHNAGKVEESRKRKIAEGINFAEMMKETDTGIAEMLSEIQADIDSFKKTGHCSDKLEAFLKIHNHGKRLMGEAVPKGPSFAPQDAMALAKPTAPFEPSRVQGTKPSMLDRAKDAVGSVAGGINKAIGHGSDDELLADLRNKSTFEDAELNELARLAGLTENCEMSIGQDAAGMEQQQGRVNISTNASTDGNKNVTITADGEAADQLMSMLKMAGMGDSDAHARLATAEPEEIEIEMEEADEQYANTPEECYQGQDVITHQGADMNREKKQFAGMPKAGDNPMATPTLQTLESMDPMDDMGRRLMRDYQSLKLRK